MLAVDRQVSAGDGVGVELGVGLLAGPGRTGAADAAVDHEVRHMDVLGRQLARHALSQAPEGELAHGEGRRAGVALDAGRGAGEENRSGASLQHRLGGCLADQKTAVAGDPQGLGHPLRIELHERARHALARVVHHHIRRPQVPGKVLEQRADFLRAAGIAAIDPRPAGPGQLVELVGIARGQGHGHALAGEEPGQGGAEAGAGPDDQGGLGVAHLVLPRGAEAKRLRAPRPASSSGPVEPSLGRDRTPKAMTQESPGCQGRQNGLSVSRATSARLRPRSFRM